MKNDNKHLDAISAIGYLIKTQELSPAQIYELIEELIEKAQADRLNQ